MNIIDPNNISKYTPTGKDFYDGSILHSRFAYNIFTQEGKGITPHPLGDAFSFVAPMTVNNEFLVDLEDSINNDFIHSDKAVNFILEIPNIDLFTGVCVQRMFNASLANVLAAVLNVDLAIDGDDILHSKPFVNDRGDVYEEKPGKLSVSIAHKVNDAVLIHTAFNITAGEKAPPFAYSTGINDEVTENIQLHMINSFYNMMGDIFKATTKTTI